MTSSSSEAGHSSVIIITSFHLEYKAGGQNVTRVCKIPVEKTAGPGTAAMLDNPGGLGYTIHRKWCYRQTVLPFSYEEVTAGLRDGRLLLFISDDLEDQSEKRNDKGTKLKQLGPCNHAAHPLS